MKLATFEKIVKALNRNKARYLVVGGMAVVAHGYGRLTYDLDLVLQLTSDNILRGFSALERLGYKPKVPVTGQQFADRKLREGWIRNKGMMVLNLFSDEHSDTPVDIFVREPFDFDAQYSIAVEEELSKGVRFRYVNIATLIAMKKKAGRDKDRDDVMHLRIIQKEVHNG
jgi:predicted nucleotidyltransferase